MENLLAAEAKIGHDAGHRNMLHLIQLRWLAALGQIATIAFAKLVMGIDLPMLQMLTVLAFLVAFNIGSHLLWHEQPIVTNQELSFALLVDIAVLTAQLYFSGGATNPFAFLYLLQVVLGVILLETGSAWAIMIITSLCMVGLTLFSEPLQLPPRTGHSFSPLYTQGLLLCFILNATLLVVFIARIIRNVRKGDAELAKVNQRAAEEEHIVRMGLLATGAAHELGTPLATLSVILNDWQHLPEFAENRELQEELTDMQTEIKRCKKIVSGILLAAGEARGESSARTTLLTFVNDVAREWQTIKPVAHFEYSNEISEDCEVVFDSTLKQMMFNLLDNAFEASPKWVGLRVAAREGTLIFTVTDQGPGFPAYMLRQLGKPYQSTKGRAGGGLGLFLVVNVARTLGGAVQAENLPDKGAKIEVTLPLSSILFEGETRSE
ncbi:ATP-binding protein [Limnobacter litoralis]|uniref:histidine kinase n=1 Tax=Limnobacter litoralis TaxID=481366 RepID=A0ABQ5YKP9_9BURK|nr:ATP-binding protein [Limnobacter litoralis]GLR25119.1 two-component sensor histidine kinase [Limnobacter litoralis]